MQINKYNNTSFTARIYTRNNRFEIQLVGYFLKIDVGNVLCSQEVALQVLWIVCEVRRTIAKRTSVL